MNINLKNSVKSIFLTPSPSEKWYKKFLKSGFSLVELVVVIAIMAVMLAVLAPALMGNTERSRAQKRFVSNVRSHLGDSIGYD